MPAGLRPGPGRGARFRRAGPVLVRSPGPVLHRVPERAGGLRPHDRARRPAQPAVRGRHWRLAGGPVAAVRRHAGRVPPQQLGDLPDPSRRDGPAGRRQHPAAPGEPVGGGGLPAGRRAGPAAHGVHGPQDRPAGRGGRDADRASRAPAPAGLQRLGVRAMADHGCQPPALWAGRLLVHPAGRGGLPVPAQVQRPAARQGPPARGKQAPRHAPAPHVPGARQPARHGGRRAGRPRPAGRRRVRDEPDRLGLAQAGPPGHGRVRGGRLRHHGGRVQRRDPGELRRARLRGVRERADPAPVPGLPEVRPGQLRGHARPPAAPPVRDRRPPPPDGPDGPALHAGRLGHLHGDAGPDPAAHAAGPQGGVPAVAGGPVPVLHVPGQGQQRAVLLRPDRDPQRGPAAGPTWGTCTAGRATWTPTRTPC